MNTKTTLIKRWGMFSVGAAVLVGATGCAPAAEPVELDADTVIVDVRTPAEYAAGHLDGAINIDLQSADFDENIAALDEDVDYLVYCKSGNRSGQATDLMEAEGLTVHDAGGIGSAEKATGLPVVR